jgi:phospholipid/cholesterol/gamma-HCH transport system substrate-binding protein
VTGRPVLVGVFVIGGVLLFTAGLFLIGSRRMLFTETFQVYAEFSAIAALNNGAKVRVAGMDAGEVENIRVPTGPQGRFRVRMRVREDLHPLIRFDSVATIQNDGLVGNKFVQVESGTEQSPLLPDAGTIQSREPFDIADLMKKMSDTIDRANTMLLDVKTNIDAALESVSDVATEAQELMNDVSGDVRVILASTDKMAADLGAIVDGIRNGRGTIGKLITDDSVYTSVKAMMADAEKAVANVREASEQAKGAIADLRGEGGSVKGVTGQLQQTLAAARDAMSDLAESTEALKRNFFFRGFFNRRGYFDLDDVTPAEYRQGALETPDRRVLKIWIGSNVLFETDANGEARLSEGGRARLDSAMSEYVRYPRSSPLIIESYSQELTRDVQYRTASRHSKLVRDYLVSRFNLDPNHVGTMVLGTDAPGSPSGKTWDGIALALFVSTTALGSAPGPTP